MLKNGNKNTKIGNYFACIRWGQNLIRFMRIVKFTSTLDTCTAHTKAIKLKATFKSGRPNVAFMT